MSSILATVAAISIFPRKKESPIAPHKRTAELAEREYDRAVDDLQRSTEELVKVIEEKLKCSHPKSTST